MCCCFLGFCRGGGLLSRGDLLGAAITAGAGMFCALFLEMAVNVTALQGQGAVPQSNPKGRDAQSLKVQMAVVPERSYFYMRPSSTFD